MSDFSLKDNVLLRGCVTISYIATRWGKPVEVVDAINKDLLKKYEDKGLDVTKIFKNLVVNTGRSKLAMAIRQHSAPFYIDRIQLGDCLVDGQVKKTSFPPDLSDTSLVHEIRTLGGQPGGTFDLDSDSSPDQVNKVEASTGTPGVLTAGTTSLLTDDNVNFLTAGVDVNDTVTVILNGEDYTMGVNTVVSSTQLEVANPSQLAGAVGYTVQTPGTQALFKKRIDGDNFPAATYGTETTIHEAGLLFTDGTLFNRVTFQQNDNDQGLLVQPTDVDGKKIDIQLDWLITF